MKKNLLITVLILLFIIQSLLNYYFWSRTKAPEIHVLEKPLRIASNFDNYSPYTILPAGTVLYDDSDSLNRRVMVYFNLQGVDFKFEKQDPNILKQPSEVSAIRSADLPDLLKEVPLTKKDIYLIIKHDEEIKDSVRSILFKTYKIDPSDYEK
ncbi:TPA: hypothetical protein PJH62_002301 [Acinetobacter nosocomialis]|uniref:hypothetical protein n=1 Tax=Acinetobacter calcoaceticus/baumannii complex TaxID=909768 RepID=UPI00046DB82C|nr:MULTISPECIES: hypothetical protein [Acinetobacter calcoaceticus/baumannii complex]MCE7533658.1 hypothetical protein [Acinetobacter nosocomialis]MDE1666266.1 hypothetical protein [Acinetobacter nosocomialis]MDE9416568.1 hypothetical protein [Acinetobacter nosocomialis]MDO7220250.1 hypothetical protein [Acinetobacter nosocomialis]HDH7779745.1 hypothetical protein [Acinetobacter nosocomialis]